MASFILRFSKYSEATSSGWCSGNKSSKSTWVNSFTEEKPNNLSVASLQSNNLPLSHKMTASNPP